MQRRLLKQIIFGFAYLIVLALFFYAGYLVLAPSGGTCFDGILNQNETDIDCGGPCLPCSVKNMESLSLVGEPIIFAANGKTTAMFTIRNRSADYGSSLLNYTVIIKNAVGALLLSKKETTFIYPSEIKTIVVPALTVNPVSAKSIDIVFNSAEWVPAEEFKKPSAAVRGVETVLTDKFAEVRGVVRNENSFSISEAVVSAVIANDVGLDIGASQTVLRDLAPFEERAFTISIPYQDQSVDVNASRAFVSVKR